jgi:phage shock protein A
VDALAQELEALRRELAEATAMNAQLLGVVSEMQHRINNLSHAVQGLEAKG